MERLVLWQRLVGSAREDDRDPKVELAWLRRAVARISAEGGTVAAVIGGSVVALFDPVDTTAAIDLALALVEESERDDDPSSAVRLAIALATGPTHLEDVPGKAALHIGPPIDRAQLLANRARVGEVVVDGATREACGARFLFHRHVGTGESAMRGHAIDRTTPRLDACRASLAKLREMRVPAALEPARVALRDAASAPGTRFVVLRGSAESGARALLDSVAHELGPSCVLRLPPSPGGHEPLGSLRAALASAFGDIAGLEALTGTLDATSSDALRAMAHGQVIALPAAIDAIATLLTATRQDRPKPWLVLDPLTGADMSSLSLVGELVERAGLDVLVVGRARPETKIPATLSRTQTIGEIAVPALKPDEARRLAEHVLGRTTDPELARRVVALSGESPVAVVETIRWLVGIGDVVHGPRGFHFRVGPRIATKVVPLEVIFAERIATLGPDAQRLLEILAVLPCGFSGALVDVVAKADGIVGRSLTDARAELAANALSMDTERIVACESLRAAILRGMPPARAGELARFVASALGERPGVKDGFVAATYAHYLAEGGQQPEAAAIFIETATRAAAHHHARAAIRLAASAVELDPSSGTRDASSRILRTVSARPRRSIPPPSNAMTTLPPPARENDATGKLAESAIGALRARDFERVERCLDTAIAQGGSLVAAERLRALAALARGDRRAATLALGRARTFAGEDTAERARNGLLEAWVRIGQGQPRESLRSALLALAGARTASDALGERAAIRTVAVCLDLLGREDDARRLRADASL